ncbi:unnamed protein product [Amoebophrya sp. A120]|nr:unnamed protein product [Amoebophrya sp. A120]|eukprot:GSA120T00023722001.1
MQTKSKNKVKHHTETPLWVLPSEDANLLVPSADVDAMGSTRHHVGAQHEEEIAGRQGLHGGGDLVSGASRGSTSFIATTLAKASPTPTTDFKPVDWFSCFSWCERCNCDVTVKDELGLSPEEDTLGDKIVGATCGRCIDACCPPPPAETVQEGPQAYPAPPDRAETESTVSKPSTIATGSTSATWFGPNQLAALRSSMFAREMPTRNEKSQNEEKPKRWWQRWWPRSRSNPTAATKSRSRSWWSRLPRAPWSRSRSRSSSTLQTSSSPRVAQKQQGGSQQKNLNPDMKYNGQESPEIVHHLGTYNPDQVAEEWTWSQDSVQAGRDPAAGGDVNLLADGDLGAEGSTRGKSSVSGTSTLMQTKSGNKKNKVKHTTNGMKNAMSRTTTTLQHMQDSQIGTSKQDVGLTQELQAGSSTSSSRPSSQQVLMEDFLEIQDGKEEVQVGMEDELDSMDVDDGNELEGMDP